MWITPQVDDAKNTGHNKKRREGLASQTYQAGGALSPAWVEWLMGFPSGYTDLEPIDPADVEAWRSKVEAGSFWDVDPADVGTIERTAPAKSIPNRRARLKGIGNAQVPACVVLAFDLLDDLF